MPGAGERFDIVVVGVQGDDDGHGDLAADVSSLTGLPPHRVSLALRGGELIVHRSLTEDDARQAASSLRRRGADVEIRSTDASEEIGPPPDFGGAASARNIDIGARSAGSPGLFDPSRPQGRPPPEVTSERPFAPAFEKAAGRARPTPGEPLEREPRPRNGAPRKPREPYVGTPRRSRGPEAREAAGQIADAHALAASLEAAAASAEAIEVVTLDGQSSESVEVKLARPNAAPEDERAAAAPERRAGPHDDRLALDFDNTRDSGPRATHPGTDASRSGAQPAASGSALSQPAMRSGANDGPPTTRRPHAPVPAALRPVGQPLFSNDRLANYLFGVAVGLGLGMVIAFGAVRVWHRGDVIALEEELAESYTKPVEVQNGGVRAPDEVERDLEAKYGDSRMFFVLTMILAGVPAGIGIGRVTR